MALLTEPDVDRHGSGESSASELKWYRRITGLTAFVYGCLVVVALVTLDWELLLPVVQLPLLLIATKAIIRRISDRVGDDSYSDLLLAAFRLKMAGTLVRAAVNALFYGGISDATYYAHFGRDLGSSFRSFDFTVSVGKLQGTGFMKLLSGVVYSFWGNSLLGAGLLFSWLAFLGMLLFWLAFRETVHRGADRRYAQLLFFLPSMVYWPSSLGKDALSVFLVGATSYGVSRVIRGKPIAALAYIALGTTGLVLLRPHIGLTLLCGFFLALALGKSRGSAGSAGLVRLLLFGALSLVLMVVIGQTQQFFGVSSLDSAGIQETLDSTTAQTQEAASAFSPVRMNSPVTALPAIVTVLYRPFPLETTNAVGMLASLEGVLLIVLTIRSRKRLRNLMRSMREHIYPAYALGASLGMIFAFSSFSNFGILTRERTQLMPLFLVLLCVPTRSEMEHEEPDVPTGAVEDSGQSPAALESTMPKTWNASETHWSFEIPIEDRFSRVVDLGQAVQTRAAEFPGASDQSRYEFYVSPRADFDLGTGPTSRSLQPEEPAAARTAPEPTEQGGGSPDVDQELPTVQREIHEGERAILALVFHDSAGGAVDLTGVEAKAEFRTVGAGSARPVPTVLDVSRLSEGVLEVDISGTSSDLIAALGGRAEGRIDLSDGTAMVPVLKVILAVASKELL